MINHPENIFNEQLIRDFLTSVESKMDQARSKVDSDR